MTVFLKELRSTVICLVCQGSDGKKGNFVDIAYMSNTGTLHINAQRGEVLENPMLFFIINKAFAGDGSAKDLSLIHIWKYVGIFPAKKSFC